MVAVQAVLVRECFSSWKRGEIESRGEEGLGEGERKRGRGGERERERRPSKAGEENERELVERVPW